MTQSNPNHGPSAFGQMSLYLMLGIAVIAAIIWVVRKVDGFLTPEPPAAQASAPQAPAPANSAALLQAAPPTSPPPAAAPAAAPAAGPDEGVAAPTVDEPPGQAQPAVVAKVDEQVVGQGPELRQAQEPWQAVPDATWGAQRQALYGRSQGCEPRRCAWFEADCAPQRCADTGIYRRVRVVSRLSEEARQRKQAVVLRGVEMDGAVLDGVDLRGADLTLADLGGASLRGADLRGATLRGVNLREADLRGADLRRADLTGAELSYARFEEADLEGARLDWTHLQKARLFKTSLRAVTLRAAVLEEVALDGVDLSGADLAGAGLRGVDMDGGDLRGATLEGARLTDSSLRGANLRGARLDSAALTRTDLGKADLRQASLEGSSWEGGDLKEARYDNETVWPVGLRFKDLGALYDGTGKGKEVAPEALAHPRAAQETGAGAGDQGAQAAHQR